MRSDATISYEKLVAVCYGALANLVLACHELEYAGILLCVDDVSLAGDSASLLHGKTSWATVTLRALSSESLLEMRSMTWCRLSIRDFLTTTSHHTHATRCPSCKHMNAPQGSRGLDFLHGELKRARNSG